MLGCIFALRKISGSKEEIYINEMAVLPERQGQGIGQQLLNAVKDYSKEKGLAGFDRRIKYVMSKESSIDIDDIFSTNGLPNACSLLIMLRPTKIRPRPLHKRPAIFIFSFFIIFYNINIINVQKITIGLVYYICKK